MKFKSLEIVYSNDMPIEFQSYANEAPNEIFYKIRNNICI